MLGVLYNELRLARGRLIILQPLHYFLRRLLLAVVIVFQDNLIVQLGVVILSFHIQIFILSVRPFKDPFTQKMEYFNEVVLMLTLYCMMCFGDLVPSVEQQVNMGWCCCLIVGGHFFINVFFMLRTNYH